MWGKENRPFAKLKPNAITEAMESGARRKLEDARHEELRRVPRLAVMAQYSAAGLRSGAWCVRVEGVRQSAGSRSSLDVRAEGYERRNAKRVGGRLR